MANKIKFTADAIIKALQERQVRATNATLEESKKYAISISPIDQGEYIKAFEIRPARITKKGQVMGELVNTSPHGQIVETGVQGKTYNYHRGPRKGPRTVIYRGIGNRTIQRSMDATRNLFNQKLARG